MSTHKSPITVQLPEHIKFDIQKRERERERERERVLFANALQAYRKGHKPIQAGAHIKQYI